MADLSEITSKINIIFVFVTVEGCIMCSDLYQYQNLCVILE